MSLPRTLRMRLRMHVTLWIGGVACVVWAVVGKLREKAER